MVPMDDLIIGRASQTQKAARIASKERGLGLFSEIVMRTKTSRQSFEVSGP